ncbi:MarR family transcriptional regulator [Streptomyces sp. RFCAC02]|uniref:MarR family winged helix-turn-helix transcriptional regulator n=1 Tax=Streptomyces sp. RFCAC02 TaxID=2499143 RepID=UPI00101F50A1|nr:MarR family transcriptional regulator [Streptomyces sp. RFCAC02]
MPHLKLDSPPDADAVNELRMAVLRLSRRLRHLSTDRTLSLAELSALGTLVRCGPLAPGELARKEHVQPPSMTRILALLQERGLVALAPHPEDRRQKLVAATDEAAEVVTASRAKRNEWLAALAEQLDEEEWATLRSAAPVLHRLAHL